jgi:hypothetical protein
MFSSSVMSLPLAIGRNRDELIRIVAALFAAAGFAGDPGPARLQRTVHQAIVAILLAAESAVRRLIVAVAHGLVATPAVARPAPKNLVIGGKVQERMAFRLFDPQPRLDARCRRRSLTLRPEPRIHFVGAAFEPVAPLFRAGHVIPAEVVAEPDATVSALPLRLRLAAINRALGDLRAQARRYARWRDKPFEQRRPKLFSSLRPGAPPGARKAQAHRIDAILHECNRLARSPLALDST